MRAGKVHYMANLYFLISVLLIIVVVLLKQNKVYDIHKVLIRKQTSPIVASTKGSVA